MGLTYVRIAEFAWSKMEPTEGVFDWQWLDDAVEALHAEGLKVIMCTPTATPPAWLIRKHPEILYTDREGRVREFGSRKHYDHASPIYREHSKRITTEIATRYGNHPAVVGWQTDNEWGCHSSTRSYGGASVPAFQAWLEERYGTLDALNDAWGNVFWSQEYSDWDQIEPPRLTVAEPNPSHVLDFYRFASDAVAEFQLDQTRILRELSPGRWITHNYMMHFGEFDHYKNCEALDFASWDSYPTGRSSGGLHRGGEGSLGAHRPSGPDLLQSRSLPRPQGSARLLGDGAGQRSGQLGQVECSAGHGSSRPLDCPGLCPWCQLRLLFPLAGGDDRPGTDALRPAPPR